MGGASMPAEKQKPKKSKKKPKKPAKNEPHAEDEEATNSQASPNKKMQTQHTPGGEVPQDHKKGKTLPGVGKEPIKSAVSDGTHQEVSATPSKASLVVKEICSSRQDHKSS